MRVASAELFEHVLDFISRFYGFEVFRLQVVLFDPFDAESKVCRRRYRLSPDLHDKKISF